MKHLKTVLFIIILIFNIKIAYCCSCIGESTVKSEIQTSDFVLVGEIVSKTIIQVLDSGLPPNYKMYRSEYFIKVISIFKGAKASDTIRIVTGIGSGDCGFKFEVGKKYIVYGDFENKYFPAAVSTVGMFLYTNICTRTMLYNENEEKEIKKNLE